MFYKVICLVMTKEKLKIVLSEFHGSALPWLVKRHLTIDFSILHSSTVNKIITIIGPRRAGKTYFLFQVMGELTREGIDLTDIIYVNFEDERILPMRAMDLQLILDAYFELYEGKKNPIIFLDEIQNIDGWDKFVRRLNDQGFRVFLTGSNSRLLGHEIATTLRGRTLTYELFPFSFAEFIAAKGITPDRNLVYGKTRHRTRQLFDEYFFSGGYPEIVFTEQKTTKSRILQDYFNTIFYRDLVERYRIKNTELLRQWLNALMSNISSLISFKKIEYDFRSRGMKLSGATLSYFARYIQDIFFGFLVELYSESVRKRQVNPKKFYLIDQGMHNYLTLNFSGNMGRVLENLIFLELRRKTDSIWYYKTRGGYEVDFLMQDNRKSHLIQVCYDLRNINTFSREKKALMLAMKELGINTGLILTLDEKRVEEGDNYSLHIVPVWEWLLT